MTKLFAVTIATMLSASAAQAQSIRTVVSPDGKSATSETSKGTATTRITPTANGFTAVTTYQAKPAYQPMGDAGYKPMGGR